MSNTSFPWHTVRDGVERREGSPIRTLINHVIDSGLSEYLYSATARQNLRVGRTENFSKLDGELLVEDKQDSDSVLFSYYDYESTRPWQKECSSEDILETFDFIISKRLRWFNAGES